MRDALIITITLVGLFLVAGYVYNVMSPHFEKLGIKEPSSAPTADEGGIFRSEDSGRTWSQIRDSGENISRQEVFEIQFDAENPEILRVASSGGLYKSIDGGNKWSIVSDIALIAQESVNSFAIDPKNSKRVYVALNSRSGQGRILKSKGDRFYEVYSTTLGGDKALGVWIDAFDTSTIYAGTGKGLFLESKDFGESWRVKKEFSGAVHGLHMIPSDTRIMYTHVGGQVFKTRNQGQSWQDISTSLVLQYGTSFKVEQISIDPHNENRLYLATSHGLLVSSDSGATFAQIGLLVSGEAPKVSAVGFDPQASDVLYVAVGSQIHKTEDGGKSWQIKKLDTTRGISVIRARPDNPQIIFAGVK